jgi:hypothetical protein
MSNPRDFDDMLGEAIRDADDDDIAGLADGDGRYTEPSVFAWFVNHAR